MSSHYYSLFPYHKLWQREDRAIFFIFSLMAIPSAWQILSAYSFIHAFIKNYHQPTMNLALYWPVGMKVSARWTWSLTL